MLYSTEAFCYTVCTDTEPVVDQAESRRGAQARHGRTAGTTHGAGEEKKKQEEKGEKGEKGEGTRKKGERKMIFDTMLLYIFYLRSKKGRDKKPTQDPSDLI